MVELDFKVKEITATEEYGEFVIEPLEPGYGYTIGNALRRVLYTSIPGAAVTQVRISGVKHKFSTLPGLKENVIDLLLNVKQLRLKLPENQETGTVKLSVKGDRVVTAADLEPIDGVEVMNKEQYLGSLSGDKAKLDIELTVERGLGYALAEEQKAGSLELIQTDAIFTPIRRVNYTVEATRVGRQTNLDKLIVKVWTNGTVNPRQAMNDAAKILANAFSMIYEPKAMSAATSESAPSAPAASPEALKLTIDELDLPTRIYNSLRNGGIETVEELLNTARKDLISMRNMGGKSLAVIEEKLREKGISLPA